MNFENKCVLVTGAGGGTGKVIAKTFLEAGATVIATDIVQPSWEKENDKLLNKVLDVSNEKMVKKVIEECNECTSGIDVLVNNAGISLEAPIHKTTLNDWEKVYSVNSTGTFLCTREVVIGMLENKKKGAIINISSIAGRNAFPGSSAYSASKASVIGLTRSLAVELGEHDITVNAICPGSVETPMLQSVIDEISTKTNMSRDETIQMMKSSIPLKRFQSPKDIASLVLYLASPFGRNITGETINVDGGVVRN